MKRRDFLAVAAAAAMTAGSAVPAFASLSKDQKLNLGLTTYMIGGKWSLEELVTNLPKAKIFYLELRTDMKYAHGVELTLNKAERQAVRKRVADSPVQLLGLACSERFDHLDSAQVDQAVEKAKQYLQMCADLGGTGLRVFPNSFHKEVPQEKTIEQIITALRRLTQTADDLGQTLCLEAHGPVGRLPFMRQIAQGVNHKRLRVMLNSDWRDTEGEGQKANLDLVADYLADRHHIHELDEKKFVDSRYYETQTEFLMNSGKAWTCLLEIKDEPNARMQRLWAMRRCWENIWNESMAACFRKTKANQGK
ncbi:MAG: TIM barrel protein [Thermoguttaceae bacterium]|nr:TIM barrel protein [Thermoguttaceae bacterium]